ncbi:MAG: hypothetical protein R3182_13850 [Draconibacterium sp.]|nr:hypothetical protein [Draconibacterium sp.]
MDTPILFITISIVLILVIILALVLIRQNRAGTYPNESEEGRKAMGKGIAIGYGIGMGPGIAIGVAMDNIGMGIAIGAGIGISIGVAMGAAFKKKAEEEAGLKRRKQEMPREVVLPKIIALIILLTGFLVLAWFLFAKMN